MPAPLPPDEELRLRTLREYNILDTLPEQGFDDIVQLASSICGAPVALISLVDSERQWFKARVGLAVGETHRDLAFCAYALGGQTLIVNDALEDARFRDNELVTGDLGIRFYAGAPLISEDGQALGTVCVIDFQPRQITETQIKALQALSRQTVAQLELRKVNRQMQLAVTGSADGLWDWMDTERPEIWWSERCCEILGYNSGEVEGTLSGAGSLLHPEDLGVVSLDLTIGAAGNLLFNFDCRLLTRSQTYLRCQLRGVVVRDEHGRVRRISGSLRDVDAERRAELDLVETRHQAEQASSAKSRFLASMSHELRTPLNAIIGFSEVLADETYGPVNSKQARYLGNIIGSGRHLLALINDILDISKVEAGKMDIDIHPLSAQVLIAEALSMTGSLARAKGIETLLEGAPPVLIKADARRFRQILFNLLSNAIKFSPPASRIVIGSQIDGLFLRIRVSDSGPGIKAEDQERVFREFEQIGGEGQKLEIGTGLGLAVSRLLVRLQGGQLWLESAGVEGCGSTFYFTLPLALEPA